MDPKEFRDVTIQIEVADANGHRTGVATMIWKKDVSLEQILNHCIQAVENIDL